MSFARLKDLSRTLSFRLMIWNALVVSLTAIITLVGMQVGVRRALLHEMDRFLLDDLQVLQDTLEGAPDAVAALESDRNVHFEKRSAAVMDQSGKVLWSTDDAMRNLVVRGKRADSQPASHDGYRFVESRVRISDGRILTARVGMPLEVIENETNRVDRLALSFASGALLVAPVLGYWLAGRVVRPLRELNERTARLRPTKKRDDRLPIGGAGDELDQLAGSINALLDRITSYLRHREDFVANAAHELRNPVAAIRSTAEVALGVERTQQEYESLLEEMIEECSRLEILVSQLLLLSESDANRLRFHEQCLDLSEVVQQSVATFGPAAESLDIRLTVASAPVFVDGNRQHLRLVVSNLLDNAVKFSAPGGSITVFLTSDADRGEAVLVVEDTGIGIDPSEIEQVFERFYRGDKARIHDDAHRGAGLGLSICKSIVEAHAGQISVASELGKGTSFMVRLPSPHRARGVIRPPRR